MYTRFWYSRNENHFARCSTKGISHVQNVGSQSNWFNGYIRQWYATWQRSKEFNEKEYLKLSFYY